MEHSMVNGLYSLGIGLCVIAAVFSTPVYAQGSVKMSGSIIETACAIDVGSRDQTIDMGSLALTQIRRDGQGPVHHFVIRLVNCVLESPNLNKPSSQYFRVTFDGAHSRGMFHVQGQAKGVGLQIQRHEDGEIAVPGKGMSIQSLTSGSRDLVYQLRLVSNHDSLASGQYASVLRFKLDYE